MRIMVLLGAGLALAATVGWAARGAGGAEQAFTVHIRAYDTTIPEATIEGVTIRNVRQFNVLNEPADLVTRVGTRVRLTIVNESPISENLSINGHAVDATLKAKERRDLAFRPTRPGAYTIWCKLHPKNVHLPGTFAVLP